MSGGASAAQPGSGAVVPPAGGGMPAGQPPGDWPSEPGPPYLVPQPGRLTLFMTRFAARLPGWAAPVGVLGCMAAAAGYTVLSDPTTSSADAIPTCLLKLTTGLDCPGCGGTRAAWYVLNGDLGAAARHHILFVFALPFLLYIYLAWAAKLSFGWRLPQLRLSPMTLGVFLAAWLVFTIVRNLPWAPFTWLYV